MKVEAIVRNCARFGKSLLVGALVLSAIACSSDHQALLHHNADSTVNPLGPVDPSTSSSSSSSGSSIPLDPSNLIVNGDLENGVNPWSYQGSTTAIELSTDEAHGGNNSLLVTGRSENWNGPVMNLPELTVGIRYDFSVWVKLAQGADPVNLKMTVKRSDDDAEATYANLASAEVTSTEWVQLKGEYIHAVNGTLGEFTVFVESTETEAPFVDFYVDDLEVRMNTSLVVNGGVEDGVEPWRYQGDGVSLAQSPDQSHSGDYSLLVTNRSAGWHAAVMDLPRDLTAGMTYSASVWVRLAEGEADTMVTMTLNRKDGTEGQSVDGEFTQIATGTATDDGWIELSGEFVHSAVGEVRQLYLYIEAERTTASYYVDDLAANPVGAFGLAAGLDKFLGNVIGSSIPASYRLYWNQVTVENGGKWGTVESTRDTMNWGTLDLAYDFARVNNMPFKLHTLVWENQAPEWIGDLTPEEQKEEVEEWISLLADRYPDVAMIDVVNEPISAPASYREALGGDGDTGWDWIVWSFEKAREYFPDAELHLNDFGILASAENKIEPYLDIIELLDDLGLIDGIGVQSHYFTVDDIPATLIQASLDRLAATGLPIYISELDFSGVDPELQRENMETKFPVFWQHPAVAGVTLWGYTEGQVWRPEDSTWLVGADGTERPAMEWLRSYFGN